MTIVRPSRSSPAQGRQALAAAGGLLGALAASSCCILPLALFGVGISGAWIGTFTRLAPYQPYFLAVAIAFLGYGYWLAYRSARLGCAQGDACARSAPSSLVKAVLVIATLLVAAALAFDLLAPVLLGS